MNKEELIGAIAAEAEKTTVDVRKFLDSYIKVTEATLAKGDSIQLINFMSLAVNERAARKGRNPATGAVIDIAASKVVKFTAGKSLKDAVNKEKTKATAVSKTAKKK